mmetsp:Transcript_7173/g.21342  ORF Transcript_7173/g.21342 Transcript_7173/m.21342 type:complete len:204 (-) Transcript_7173:239-850(-)
MPTCSREVQKPSSTKSQNDSLFDIASREIVQVNARHQNEARPSVDGISGMGDIAVENDARSRRRTYRHTVVATGLVRRRALQPETRPSPLEGEVPQRIQRDDDGELAHVLVRRQSVPGGIFDDDGIVPVKVHRPSLRYRWIVADGPSDVVLPTGARARAGPRRVVAAKQSPFHLREAELDERQDVIPQQTFDDPPTVRSERRE